MFYDVAILAVSRLMLSEPIAILFTFPSIATSLGCYFLGESVGLLM
jgi:hypothetical protein